METPPLSVIKNGCVADGTAIKASADDIRPGYWSNSRNVGCKYTLTGVGYLGYLGAVGVIIGIVEMILDEAALRVDSPSVGL